MAQGQKIEIEIPSSAKYVSVVRQTIESIARRMNFEKSQIDDLKIAVGEACTNAIKYGCQDEETGTVLILCEIHHDFIVIEVRNSIDGCSIPSVPIKPDTSKEGGLGLYLMRQLMDEVDINWMKDKAIVRMVKHISTPVKYNAKYTT